MTRPIVQNSVPTKRWSQPAVLNGVPTSPTASPRAMSKPSVTAAAAPPAAAAPAQNEAELRAQLEALEQQLAVARMQNSLSQVQQSNNDPPAEPDGEYEGAAAPVEDDDEEEIIVIEEIIEDGEDFEEVIVVEEEVYDDDEEEVYEEYVEETENDEEMVEEVYEEIVEESVRTEEDDTPVVSIQAFEPKQRQGPPPQVPLVDPPREQAPPPPAPVPAGPPQAVAAGPPQPVPAGPPQPVPAREAGPKNAPSALAANKANEAAPSAAEGEAKPRKKWIPMSQRFPEKFKSKDPQGAKALANAGKPSPISGAPISKSDKPQKLKPLPWRPKTYPTVPASPAGKETPMEKWLGTHLLKNVQMQKITVNSATQGQGLMCLYFGAAWRKECKAIHQQLIDFYRLTTKDEKIEFVYVSADRTLFEFKDIFQKFDFLAMPTGTTQLKNALTKQLKIVDMPFVAVFDVATGHVVTADAAQEILDWPSRDKPAALALVQSWKQTKAVPIDKLQRANKASGSQVTKGNLIWS